MSVFLNEVRLATTASGTSTIELAGDPATSLVGYRVSAYRVLSGALTYISTITLADVPSSFGDPPYYAVVRQNGTWLRQGGYVWSQVPVAIALHAPGSSATDPSGLIEFLQFGAGAYTAPVGGPAAGLTPTIVNLTQPAAPGTFIRVGSGTPVKTNFTWATSSTSSYGSPNPGQTLIVPPVVGNPDPPLQGVPTALGERVQGFLTGRYDDYGLAVLCSEAAKLVTTMARRYTRTNGFLAGVPEEEIENVIVSATARLVANPEQTESQVGTVALRSHFTGWSPIEELILGSYRGRAA